MNRFFCFEHVSRPSQHTPEWCTLRFSNNETVSILARDKIRRTKPTWDAVGTYMNVDNKRLIFFNENSFATRLAATVMIRKWNAICFFGLNRFTDTEEFGSVAYHNVTQWRGRITNPNTIRNKGQVRRTSLDLGLKPASGETHGNTKE